MEKEKVTEVMYDPRVGYDQSLAVLKHAKSCKEGMITKSSIMFDLAVGLAAVEGVRIAGASRIIGVDLSSNRFEEARKFGCMEFINPKDHEKLVQEEEVLAEMTNGGVDCSVECTGNINALIQAFECVHDGWGVAVLVGVLHKDAEFRTRPMNFLNSIVLHFLRFAHKSIHSDAASVLLMVLKLKDWEDGLSETDPNGSFLHGHWNSDLKLVRSHRRIVGQVPARTHSSQNSVSFWCCLLRSFSDSI
jgi:hypothetical protein